MAPRGEELDGRQCLSAWPRDSDAPESCANRALVMRPQSSERAAVHGPQPNEEKEAGDGGYSDPLPPRHLGPDVLIVYLASAPPACRAVGRARRVGRRRCLAPVQSFVDVERHLFASVVPRHHTLSLPIGGVSGRTGVLWLP